MKKKVIYLLNFYQKISFSIENAVLSSGAFTAEPNTATHQTIEFALYTICGDVAAYQ